MNMNIRIRCNGFISSIACVKCPIVIDRRALRLRILDLFCLFCILN